MIHTISQRTEALLDAAGAAAPDSPAVLSLGGIAREMLAVAGRQGRLRAADGQ